MLDIKEKVLQPLNIVMHYIEDGESVTVSARIYNIRKYPNVGHTLVQLGDISKTIFLRIYSKGLDLNVGDLIVAKGIKKKNYIEVDEFEVIPRSERWYRDKSHRMTEQTLFLLRNDIHKIAHQFMIQQGFLFSYGQHNTDFVNNCLDLDIPRAFGFGSSYLYFYATYSTHEELFKVLQLLLNTIQHQLGIRIGPSEIPEGTIEGMFHEDHLLSYQNSSTGKSMLLHYKNDCIGRLYSYPYGSDIGLSYATAELNLEKLLTILYNHPIIKE